MKDKTFPFINQTYKEDTKNDVIIITLESYVRIKKEKKYYYVKVFRDQVFSKEDFTFQHSSIFLNIFINSCMQVKHLWVLPPENKLKELIVDDSVTADHRDLSNKELFLLETYIH